MDDKAQIDSVDVIFTLDCCWPHLATRSADHRERGYGGRGGHRFPRPNREYTWQQGVLDSTALGSYCKGLKPEIRTYRVRRAGQRLAGRRYAKEAYTWLTRWNKINPAQAPGITRPIALRGPATLRAYFSIRVHSSVGQSGLDARADWINRLPPHIVFEIDRVFETESQCWVVYADWALYSKLAGLPGIALICETKGGGYME